MVWIDKYVNRVTEYVASLARYRQVLATSRFGNVREDLIFANIRELVASRIQNSR